MTRIVAATALLLASFVTVAISQEKATAKPGQEVRVGWIGVVDKQCQVSPPPTVVPSTLPQHGRIKLMKATVTTKSIPGCPETNVPAIVVFYMSSVDFTGTDTFALKSSNADEPRSYSVEVR